MGKKTPVKFALFGAGTRGELDLGYFFKKNHKKIRYWAVAEADPYRRAKFIEKFKISKENAFRDWKDLLEKPKLADAIINALPCRLHHESTIAALKAGYDVLLEKPMAHTPGECVHLTQAAKKYGRKLAIAFENRYNSIYLKVKELLELGTIGQLMDVSCVENIGWWHYVVSYVRGIHSRMEEGNSFMIAKGIHDTDLITWFIESSRASKVSSFGDLLFFNKKNAPSGAPERCIDGCPIQNECLFDAVKLYYKPGRPKIPISLLRNQTLGSIIDVIKEPRFRTFASIIARDISKPNILKILRETPHGKCVFRSDNGVTDHQSTSIEYENGVTCSFSLSAFSEIWERTCDLRGTQGEIMSKDWSGRLELRTFNPPKVIKERFRFNGLHHGGGDELLLLDFANAVKNDDPDVKSLTTVENCLESHLLALAAEEARINKKIVDMAVFRRRAEEEAKILANKKLS